MKVRSETEPSRWIKNLTSAFKRAAGFLGLKLSAICRTMLLRYPGNGNSIPSARTVATSVPLSPVGPPPAFGASVLGLLAVFVSLGVLAFDFVVADALISVGVRRAVIGAGLGFVSGASLIVDGAGVGWVTDVLAAGVWVFTSPIALSPGGAATMLTRYIGGNATGLRSFRLLKRSVATAACSTSDNVNGAESPDPSRTLLGIISPRAARRLVRYHQ